jgi:hypothetical protein
MMKKGIQGAAKEAQRVAKDTARIAAKPFVHAAKRTATVAKAAKQNIDIRIKERKRYVCRLCCKTWHFQFGN